MTRANYPSKAFDPVGNPLVLTGVKIRKMSSSGTEVESLRLDSFSRTPSG